jgi:hypothetical protein
MQANKVFDLAHLAQMRFLQVTKKNGEKLTMENLNG